ncbi:helix-turn-helix domain-containing protein [Photobacterium lipolyticum]|uniref:HTH araC/xylS-type domain-containing protein n=1 Tax=Photobacterium lipolyticum TaxID=266810 RepID=A0A2T3MWX7_9GAMM|nr:hypothetical protein C9I89_14170 [Photobacterium lipolyticum]
MQQKTVHAITLLNRDISIINIAQKMGDSDPENFTRAFKRHAGLSPSSFRREGLSDIKPESRGSIFSRIGSNVAS